MSIKIYFICPNADSPIGGIKQIYRQVELLNKNGINAVILHEKKGSREKWFASDVPIKYSPYIFKKIKYLLRDREITFRNKLTLYFLKKVSEKIEKNAILVFPEIYGDKINEIEPEIAKVIFNQGCYLTFKEYSIYKNYIQTPYNHINTLATIVASEDAYSYLRFSFPNITQLNKITLGINPSNFHYSDKKRKQICFMTRKLSEDLNQVINILKLRNGLKDWNFVPIENKTEVEVAEIMKESLMFLYFSRCEGFGLPPIEAMACGCYVIGYHGQGGKEFFKPEFSSTIENGDIIAYVQKIEEMVEYYEQNPSLFLQKGKEASDFVLNKYSFENEEKTTIQVWNEILNLKEKGV